MDSPNKFADLLKELATHAEAKSPGGVRATWDDMQTHVGTFEIAEDGAIFIGSSSDEEGIGGPRIVIFDPEKDYMCELYVECVRVQSLLARGRFGGDEKFYVEKILREAVVNALKCAENVLE